MLIKRIKSFVLNPVARDIGWLGLAQIATRIFRLVTTVVLARIFTSYDYGLVAILYTVHGFAETFTFGGMNTGIVAKVVQTDEQNLSNVCNTSYWISWFTCGTVCLIQCALAFPISTLLRAPELVLPICVLSTMYLMYPVFKVNAGLLQRAGNFKVIALGRAAEAILTNIITVTLCFLGMGIWSIVWGMVLSTPAWIIVAYQNSTWRPPKKLHLQGWQPIAKFSISLLGVSLLDKLREQLDYILVGRFLGVEALGLYFFAFNAGIGISRQVINAMLLSVYSRLCQARLMSGSLATQYWKNLRFLFAIITVIVSFQSILSPFYVPIVFGEKWVDAIPILIITCLSAIPMLTNLIFFQLLNAMEKVNLTLIWNAAFMAVFSITLIISVQFNIFAVAVSVLICQTFNMLATVYASRKVLSST